MAPDTAQNLLVMAKLMIEHNFLAMVFLGGLMASAGYALWKPSRGIILIMIGFGLLLFAFQYEKHIADALIEQTTGSLVTARQSGRIEWVVQKILGKAATPLLYLTGFTSLCMGTFLLYKQHQQAK